jgi:hypothetical protein
VPPGCLVSDVKSRPAINPRNFAGSRTHHALTDFSPPSNIINRRIEPSNAPSNRHHSFSSSVSSLTFADPIEARHQQLQSYQYENRRDEAPAISHLSGQIGGNSSLRLSSNSIITISSSSSEYPRRDSGTRDVIRDRHSTASEDSRSSMVARPVSTTTFGPDPGTGNRLPPWASNAQPSVASQRSYSSSSASVSEGSVSFQRSSDYTKSARSDSRLPFAASTVSLGSQYSSSSHHSEGSAISTGAAFTVSSVATWGGEVLMGPVNCSESQNGSLMGWINTQFLSRLPSRSNQTVPAPLFAYSTQDNQGQQWIVLRFSTEDESSRFIAMCQQSSEMRHQNIGVWPYDGRPLN